MIDVQQALQVLIVLLMSTTGYIGIGLFCAISDYIMDDRKSRKRWKAKFGPTSWRLRLAWAAEDTLQWPRFTLFGGDSVFECNQRRRDRRRQRGEEVRQRYQ